MLFHSMAGSMYYSYYYYVFCAGWKHISAAKCSNVIVNTMFVYLRLYHFFQIKQTRILPRLETDIEGFFSNGILVHLLPIYTDSN